jgi:hypothetical protein
VEIYILIKEMHHNYEGPEKPGLWKPSGNLNPSTRRVRKLGLRM